MSNTIALHTITDASVDTSKYDAESRYFDGSKYVYKVHFYGKTDDGVSYDAHAQVLVQTWTDKTDAGQYVLTTDVKVEDFPRVAAYGATKFGSDYNAERAYLDGLTDAERDEFYDADEAAQEAADAKVLAYLERAARAAKRGVPSDERIEFVTGAIAIIEAIRDAAHRFHVNAR